MKKNANAFVIDMFKTVFVGTLVLLGFCFLAFVVLCLCRVDSMLYFLPVLYCASVAMVIKTLCEFGRRNRDRWRLTTNMVCTIIVLSLTIWGMVHYIAEI